MGAKRAQRVAIALLPVVIGMCATGSVSLVMQRSSLKHVVVIVGVTHAVLMIVLCARYRYHLASPLLAWSAGTGVVLSVLQCVVAWGYWRMGPGPDDFGWPLTDFVLISLVCFVLSLIASVLIWGITAPAGAYVAQGDEPRDSSRAST